MRTMPSHDPDMLASLMSSMRCKLGCELCCKDGVRHSQCRSARGCSKVMTLTQSCCMPWLQPDNARVALHGLGRPDVGRHSMGTACHLTDKAQVVVGGIDVHNHAFEISLSDSALLDCEWAP
ncbi:unnamed protein product [Effrenium voratum]|nr:unnamed protein product [Effrenium voratum]